VTVPLATFALLVALWGFAKARRAETIARETKLAVTRIARSLREKLGPLVDEAEGKRPTRPPVDTPAESSSNGKSTVEEAPGNRGGPPSGREALDGATRTGGRVPASPRPPQTHGGGKAGPSPATRDLAVTAKEILAKRGDTSPADLRDELGLTIKSFAKVRALLNADADVVTYGQTKTRRYKLRDGAPTTSRRQQIAVESTVDGRSPRMPSTPGPKKHKQQPKLDGRVMSSIQLLPKSASGLAKDLRVPLDEVMTTLRRLEREGDVRRHDSGNWVATP
jgi:hypothetical protein